MIPIVSFVGDSGSGKTSLLEGIIRELKQRGYRVAVVKHAPCGFEIDYPGKDSWRLAQAGSDIVVISSPQKMAFIEQGEEELSLEQIVTMVTGKVDIVLTEGYKQANTVKIVVSRSQKNQDIITIVNFLINQIHQNRLVTSGKAL